MAVLHFTRAKRYVKPVVITDMPSQCLINGVIGNWVKIDIEFESDDVLD
jgi:hypothetical protein